LHAVTERLLHVLVVFSKEQQMEECIVVSRITFPFGEEFTKVALYHAMRLFGTVLSIELSGNSATVLFKSSTAAQKAYLEMNGFVLFDSVLSVSIGEKIIAPGLGSSALSSSATSLVLCEGADVSWVKLFLKRIRGVIQVEAVSGRQCLVRLEDPSAGQLVLDLLCGTSSPTATIIVAHFVQPR
jgi:hypothetical protein